MIPLILNLIPPLVMPIFLMMKLSNEPARRGRRYYVEPERIKGLKILGTMFAGQVIFGLPVFRSGGRTGLSFTGWVVNHTVFGPPVEYVPEEDYVAELTGVKPEAILRKGRKPLDEEIQSAMRYYQLSEPSARVLITHQDVTEVARNGHLHLYDDLLANVRHDGKYHSIRSLVQPDDPEVRNIARVLVQAPDFVEVTQEFVDTFTTYRSELGDYWELPSETLGDRAADCDGKAILLASILRNYLPPESVFVAFGLWNQASKLDGHAWVVTEGDGNEDRIIEATAGPNRSVKGKYILHAIFNDVYAFSTDIGLREFDLQPVEKALVG